LLEKERLGPLHTTRPVLELARARCDVDHVYLCLESRQGSGADLCRCVVDNTIRVKNSSAKLELSCANPDFLYELCMLHLLQKAVL